MLQTRWFPRSCRKFPIIPTECGAVANCSIGTCQRPTLQTANWIIGCGEKKLWWTFTNVCVMYMETVQLVGVPLVGGLTDLELLEVNKQLSQPEQSWWLSFGTLTRSVLWMWCQKVRPSVQMCKSRPSKHWRSASAEFGLTRIQEEFCFSTAMHALTQVWEPGNKSPKMCWTVLPYLAGTKSVEDKGAIHAVKTRATWTAQQLAEARHAGTCFTLAWSIGWWKLCGKRNINFLYCVLPFFNRYTLRKTNVGYLFTEWLSRIYRAWEQADKGLGNSTS